MIGPRVVSNSYSLDDTRMLIQQAETDSQIASTFDVMRQLRPHLVEGDYVARVRGLMASDGFRLAYLSVDGQILAVAGYRILDMLYCGRLLYVDDLVSDEGARSRGCGAKLLDWLKEEGRRHGCGELQLISRTTRERAHRFYYREGMAIECFHFRAEL